MEGTIKLNLSKKYFLLVVMLTITIVHAFGEPTKDADGYYKLSTKEDMVWLKDNASKGYMCKLINDIDLGTWEGIGSDSEPFTGVLDGNGNKIIMRIEAVSGGLFLYTKDATIKNLHLEGVMTIPSGGQNFVGSAVAYAESTKIINVTSNVNITLSKKSYDAASCFGGIVGKLKGGTIYGCTYNGTIDTKGFKNIIIGGVCAQATSGEISMCYFTGTIKGGNGRQDYCVGGILGETNGGDVSIINNFSFGNYSFNQIPSVVGTIAGDASKGNVTLEGNYYNSDNGYNFNPTNGASSDNSTGFNNNSEITMKICSSDQYNFFAQKVNEGFKVNVELLSNLDFTGNNITQVGTITNPFKGTFDGGHYSIKNINISSTDPVAGLFGYVDGATIKNFAVDGNIKTDAGVNDAYCGLIAKVNGTTNISQIICEVNYDCKAQQGKQCYLGSIVAHSNGDTNINNSLSTGELKGWAEWGQKPNVGGFVALNNGSITIKNCYSCNSFNVDRWNSYYFAFAPNTNATFSNCYQYNITDLFNNPSNYSKVEKSDVKSGVLCAKLNNGQATPVWGQVVGNDLTGEYDYPRPESKNIITKDSEGYYHAGMIKLIMNENELVIPDNKDIVSDNMQLTTQLTDTYWHPIYLPIRLTYESWKDKFDVAKIMNFHDYEVDDVRYVVLEVEKVNQGTLRENHPYIIRAKETSSEPQVLTLSSSVFTDDQCRTLYKLDDTKTIDCATTETKYTFKGTYSTKTDFADSDYILTNGYLNKDAMSADGTKVVYPGGWYMTTTSRISSSISSSSSARRIAIRFSGFDEYEVANELTELETGIEVPFESKTEAYPVSYFANNGMKIDAPQKGLNIVKMSDGSVKKLWVK